MSSKRRQCRNHPDVFCYICGEYMLAKYRFNVRDFTKRAYKAYFGIKLGDQNKSLATPKVCKQCTEMLCRWIQGKANSMRFGFLWYGWTQKSPQRLLFLHCRYDWKESVQEERLVLSWYTVCATTSTTLHWSSSSCFHLLTWSHCRWNTAGSNGR